MRDFVRSNANGAVGAINPFRIDRDHAGCQVRKTGSMAHCPRERERMILSRCPDETRIVSEKPRTRLSCAKNLVVMFCSLPLGARLLGICRRLAADHERDTVATGTRIGLKPYFLERRHPRRIIIKDGHLDPLGA